MFAEKERAYLKEQKLARIATASATSQPDVSPVGFDFDGDYFYFGGIDLTRTLKYKNTENNPKVALVLDDLETVKPWRPRGIKIHATADRVEREGYVGRGTYSGSNRTENGAGVSTWATECGTTTATARERVRERLSVLPDRSWSSDRRPSRLPRRGMARSGRRPGHDAEVPRLPLTPRSPLSQ